MADPHPKLTTLLELPSKERPGFVHGVGTPGCIVEADGPKRWLVKVHVLDKKEVPGAWYEFFHLYDDEFTLVREDR